MRRLCCCTRKNRDQSEIMFVHQEWLAGERVETVVDRDSSRAFPCSDALECGIMFQMNVPLIFRTLVDSLSR